LPVVIVALGTLPGTAARAEWSTAVEAGLVRETNVGRGQLEQDLRSDTAATLAASVRNYLVLGDRGTLSLGATVSAAQYQDLRALGHLDPGLALGYRHKFGVGPEAPWISLRTTLARLNYRDSVRNGWLETASVSAGRTVGERWDLRVEAAYEKRTADENNEVVPGLSGAAFAQRNRVLSAQADYAWSDAITLSAAYTRRQGDVTPTTQRNFPIFEASTAIAADPAFGSDWFAYRLPATTHLFFAGLSRALGSHSSLNLGIERQVSYGSGGNDYYNTVGSVSFAYGY
jgi:hypothetical protein